MNANLASETSPDNLGHGSTYDLMIDAVRKYWNENIHDSSMAKRPVGTKEFFEEIESYHYEKLDYLPRIVDFHGYAGKELLEVGCGIGIDLVRFAIGGALVTGIDLSEVAVNLAKKNFALHGVEGELLEMNGENLKFENHNFDVVFAHGVLAYTFDAQKMINEIHRVLKPGGEAILMMYHRNSWLFYTARLFGIRLERDDAPAFNLYTRPEFNSMLSDFPGVEILTVRYPRRTRLHRGVKAQLFNALFVPAFKLIPKSILRPFGAHLIARAIK